MTETTATTDAVPDPVGRVVDVLIRIARRIESEATEGKAATP